MGIHRTKPLGAVNRTAGHRRAGDEFWHFRGAILELRTECARLPKFGGFL